MLLYDANQREVVGADGEVIRVPTWIAQAAADSDDPSRWIRFWLRAQGRIAADEEVATLDIIGPQPIPVEAWAPVD